MNSKDCILSRTENGLIFKCNNCSLFHLEYKNFILNLSVKDFNSFSNYILILNEDVSLSDNFVGKFCKNITIPTKSESLQLIVNNEELEELALLFLLLA